MMGYDKSLPHQTGLLTLGIAGGYSRSDLDLANNSEGSVDSYSAALYASYYDQCHFWLDGMLKGNLFNQHLNIRMSSGGHADGSYTIPGMGGSLIAGYDARFAGPPFLPLLVSLASSLKAMITGCRTECRRITVRLNPRWGKSGSGCARILLLAMVYSSFRG